jgi:hypothetical protein
MAKGSRRRDSWGSITEVERGKRYRIRYWASTDERGYMRHCVTVRGTRADAERKRAELMLGHSKDAPCPTMRQIYEKWYLPDRERKLEAGDLSVKTMQQDASLWNAHVSKRWADVPCDQIRPFDVQRWITSSLRGTTASRAVNQGKRILEYAVRYEFIPSNPMAVSYVMPSKSTIEKRDDYTWSLRELGELWRDHAYGKFWEGAFICAAFGSARVGEALAPLADDVWTCERNGVFVAVVPIRSQVSNTTKDIDETLKTTWSPRDIVIPGAAGRRLAQIAERNAGTYLTSNGVGGYVQQWRLWDEWTTELGQDAHPFKNLRKSWETFTKWYLKIPEAFVERMIGHVGLGVTGAHYDRPEVEDFIDVLTEKYAEKPYAEDWDWCKEQPRGKHFG